MRFTNIQTNANKSSINVPKAISSCITLLITYVINCVLHDGTSLDSFIDLTTTGMCHLNIVSASQAPIHKFTWQRQHSTRRRLLSQANWTSI